VVLTDSHGISRAPCYLGYTPRGQGISRTGLSPTPASRSKLFRYTLTLTLETQQRLTACPATPVMQPLPGITHHRFSLIRVRSPLLPESLLFSLPVGTEMFHFPTFPHPALYIQAGVTRYARALAGFPHSEILESQPVYRLPEAYRRLLRPSSAPDAKASTVCS
jgi:hypothetical protein